MIRNKKIRGTKFLEGIKFTRELRATKNHI